MRTNFARIFVKERMGLSFEHFELSDREARCLSCPLAECDDLSPDCPINIAKAKEAGEPVRPARRNYKVKACYAHIPQPMRFRDCKTPEDIERYMRERKAYNAERQRVLYRLQREAVG